MKNSPVFRLTSWIVVVSFLLSQNAAFANPSFSGAESGQISIDEQGLVYNIYASDRAIGNFNSFSNLAGETINSIQASSDHTALYRVIGQDPSTIFGALNANSHIFLINPNGIFFGAGSSVNAPGLVASTLDINNSDFLNKNYVFESTQGGSGYIENQGNLTGGYIALLGQAVNNSGTITTDGGQTVLAAGNKATLSLDSDGLVNVQVDNPVNTPVYDFQGNQVNDAISNSGVIQANGGTVILSAQAADQIFDNVINHSGIIEANTIGSENGEVLIHGGSEGVTRISGTINAKGDDTGETGGTVHVLGDKVGLFDFASIHASGDAGGGEVLVGGDVRGENPEVQNASATYVSVDARISADALGAGNGGKVIVFGQDLAKIYGTLSARGGAVSGDGGFIETSGKESFEILRMPDVSAPNGVGGLWLIDPNNIEIVAGGGNVNINAATPFVSTDDTAQLGVDLINAALNLDTSVEVNTATDGGNSEDGDITISATIAKTAGIGADLTLRAHDDISQNANISSTVGGLTVTMIADNDSSGAGAITLTNASIDSNGQAVNLTAASGITLSGAGSDISTGGGNYTVDADANNDGVGVYNQDDAGSAVSTAGGSISITASNVGLTGTLNSGAGAIEFLPSAATTTIDVGEDQGDSFVITDAELNNITSGNLTIGNSNTVAIYVASVTAASTDGISGTTTFTAGEAAGDVYFCGSMCDTSESAVFTNSVVANAINSVESYINLTSNAGDITLNADTDADSTGVVTILAPVTTMGGDVIFNTTTNVNLTGADADVTTGGGDYTVNADTDGNGTGTYAQDDAGGAVSTGGGAVSIIASAVALTGTIAAGVGNVALTTADVAATIGVADSAQTFNLTDAELDNITSTGTITIGDTLHNGAMTIGVDGALSQGAKNFIFMVNDTTITLDAGFSFTTTGDVTFRSDSTVTLAGALSADDVLFRSNEDSVIIAFNSTGGGGFEITDASVDNVAATGTVTFGYSGHTGRVLIGLDANITQDKPLVFIDSTGIALSGDITTTGNSVTFTGTFLAENFPANGTTTHTIDITNGGAVAAGADVVFNSPVGGFIESDNLVINAGTGGDVTFGGAVGVDGGCGGSINNLTIAGAHDVNFNSTVDLDGDLTETDLVADDGSGVTTFSNTVTVAGAVDVTNDAIVFDTAGNIDAGANAVTLTAQVGAITSGTSGNDVTAGVFTATAATGIGTGANPLLTTVTSADLSVTAAGAIVMTEFDGVTLTDVDTFDGAITITAGGAMTVTSVLSDTGVAGTNDIILTAPSMVMSTLTSDDDIILTATTTNITDGNGATLNITGDNLTFTTITGFGTAADPLELMVNSLNPNGPFFLALTGNSSIDLSASTGATSLSTTGTLTITAGTAGPGTVTSLDLTAGNSILTSGNAVLGADSISLTATNGTIGDIDNIVLLDWTQTATLTAGGNPSDNLLMNVAGQPGRGLELNILFGGGASGLVLYNFNIIGGAAGTIGRAISSFSDLTNSEILGLGQDNVFALEGFFGTPLFVTDGWFALPDKTIVDSLV